MQNKQLTAHTKSLGQNFSPQACTEYFDTAWLEEQVEAQPVCVQDSRPKAALNRAHQDAGDKGDLRDLVYVAAIH